MGIFYSCFAPCWGKREPEIKTDILTDKLITRNYYLTDNGITYHFNSYYTALANDTYCKMCEKPKGLIKGVLFCTQCNDRYFSN